MNNLDEQSLHLALEVYELAQKHNRPIELARSELALTIYWTTVGDLDKGQYHGERALKQYETIHDIEEQTNILMTLGWTYQLQGNFTNAERMFQRLLVSNDSRGNIYQAAQGNIWLALLYNAQSKYLTAKNYALKALQLFEEIGGQAYAIAVRKNIAIAYWGLGNYPGARNYYNDALDIFLKNQKHFIAGILSTMAWMVYLLESDHQAPLAVELGTFILHHPTANHESRELAQKIMPKLESQLSPIIFETAEDRGRTATMEQIIYRLKSYLIPEPRIQHATPPTPPDIQELISQVLEKTITTNNAQEISKSVMQQIEQVLEEQKSKMMIHFIDNASHDLRTPITIINSSLYLLEHITDPKRQKDKLSVVKRQVDHLHEIIEKLILMSRLDQGVDYHFERINLVHIVQLLHNQLESKQQTDINLKLDLGNPSIYIKGDNHYLQIAIKNLIANALQYNDSEDKQLWIICDCNEKEAFVQVIDNGRGINEKQLPYIFDRFYRVDHARTHNEMGQVGLGLSITKSIIDAHHGLCYAESQLDQGTKFTIILPLLPTPLTI